MLSKPNVFVDFHHAGLLQSFIHLFEKRLEGQVFRPIGMEWATQGFWKVYDHPATQEQFLGIGGATPDGTERLNEIEEYVSPGFYLCHDIESHETNKAITFQKFMDTRIDIVIASLPAHIEPFKRLCELHPDHPKLIFQIGNAWTIEAGLAPNVMASAIINDIPENIHFISYHQEFDTNIFAPSSKILVENNEIRWPEKNIFSFVNCFNVLEHFDEDWRLFQRVEQEMLDWNFKSYGGQCRNGSIGGARNLSVQMREARFIWHTKNGGDGYGHVLHNAAAVGRPIITRKLYYAGKMGEKLMIDGKTCIAIDGMGVDEIKNKINYYSEPERYAEMCANVYFNFREVCDFNKEFESLQIFLNNLL